MYKKEKEAWCTYSLKDCNYLNGYFAHQLPSYLKPKKANMGVTQTVLHYSLLLFSADLCHTPRTKPCVIPGEINHATRFSRTTIPRAR